MAARGHRILLTLTIKLHLNDRTYVYCQLLACFCHDILTCIRGCVRAV